MLYMYICCVCVYMYIIRFYRHIYRYIRALMVAWLHQTYHCQPLDLPPQHSIRTSEWNESKHLQSRVYNPRSAVCLTLVLFGGTAWEGNSELRLLRVLKRSCWFRDDWNYNLFLQATICLEKKKWQNTDRPDRHLRAISISCGGFHWMPFLQALLNSLAWALNGIHMQEDQGGPEGQTFGSETLPLGTITCMFRGFLNLGQPDHPSVRDGLKVWETSCKSW